MPHLLGNCRACGYSLNRLLERRCPECGAVFDPANPATMDFNHARWPNFFRRKTTFFTWVPALIALAYAIVVATAFSSNRILAALCGPAIFVIVATLYVTSVRRRLAKRLKIYEKDRRA